MPVIVGLSSTWPNWFDILGYRWTSTFWRTMTLKQFRVFTAFVWSSKTGSCSTCETSTLTWVICAQSAEENAFTPAPWGSTSKVRTLQKSPPTVVSFYSNFVGFRLCFQTWSSNFDHHVADWFVPSEGKVVFLLHIEIRSGYRMYHTDKVFFRTSIESFEKVPVGIRGKIKG